MNEVIIIGAGLSGLSCARVLQQAGKDVLLLDKARGVGGRVCTRRFEGRIFNHGAQYVTAKGASFSNVLRKLEEQGDVRKWFSSLQSDKGPTGPSYPRYVGTPAMSAIPKALAKGLKVEKQTRVVELEQRARHWRLITEDKRIFEAQTVILTPPPPQTLELLRPLPLDPRVTATLAQITYDKCISVMFALGEPAPLDPPGGMVFIDKEPIAWLSNNVHGGMGLTVHLGPQTSEDYFEKDEALLLQRLQEALSFTLDIRATQVHRWRYSIPREALNTLFLDAKSKPPLYICGESFAGARVEGAFRSGEALAREILTEQERALEASPGGN